MCVDGVVRGADDRGSTTRRWLNIVSGMSVTWSIRIADATDRADAQALIFEYIALTQAEIGQPIPTGFGELPEPLRDECRYPDRHYRAPGALLLAFAGHRPVGCVGLLPVSENTAEVKRLYVRPALRGRGVAADLMERIHRHAAGQGFARLVLDVLPTRTAVISFYRCLGYVDAEPHPSPIPMVYLCNSL